MKRINSEKRISWIQLCKKREKKRLKRLNKKKTGRGYSKPDAEQNNVINIKAPKVFELRNKKQHKKLMQFILKIRAHVLTHNRKIRIDFSATESMVVCGTLRFFAELNLIKKEKRSLNLIACTYPKNNRVAQVLQHLGILKMLNCNCSITPDRDDVINWKTASGENTDATNIGEILETQSNLPKHKSKNLYRGVSEAMTNVSQHAYLGLKQTSNHKSWWMFCKEENDQIFVAFCDLGVGIPITLPQSLEKNKEENLFVQVRNKFFPNRKKLTDGELIHAAIEVKRSRTKKNHRGKGLLDMIKVIGKTKCGNLAIFSNRGIYQYKLDDLNPIENTRSYKDSISGTLILWSLPLKNEGKNNE